MLRHGLNGPWYVGDMWERRVEEDCPNVAFESRTADDGQTFCTTKKVLPFRSQMRLLITESDLGINDAMSTS